VTELDRIRLRLERAELTEDEMVLLFEEALLTDEERATEILRRIIEAPTLN
jgi:hypothetical protein